MYANMYQGRIKGNQKWWREQIGPKVGKGKLDFHDGGRDRPKSYIYF